jgi:hypothetical protein
VTRLLAECITQKRLKFNSRLKIEHGLTVVEAASLEVAEMAVAVEATFGLIVEFTHGFILLRAL